MPDRIRFASNQQIQQLLPDFTSPNVAEQTRRMKYLINRTVKVLYMKENLPGETLGLPLDWCKFIGLDTEYVMGMKCRISHQPDHLVTVGPNPHFAGAYHVILFNNTYGAQPGPPPGAEFVLLPDGTLDRLRAYVHIRSEADYADA